MFGGGYFPRAAPFCAQRRREERGPNEQRGPNNPENLARSTAGEPKRFFRATTGEQTSKFRPWSRAKSSRSRSALAAREIARSRFGSYAVGSTVVLVLQDGRCARPCKRERMRIHDFEKKREQELLKVRLWH